jgi:malonate-semialdehyde dehydrogenase (acetylating) / methylmalonate-semialdehyde dehydrogenase
MRGLCHTAVLVGETRNWIPELIERTKKLKVSGGFEEKTDVCVMVTIIFIIGLPCVRGPLISPAAKDRAISLIKSAESEGGNILLDGRRTTVPEYPNGNFLGPTIIDANTSMQCYKWVFCSDICIYRF